MHWKVDIGLGAIDPQFLNHRGGFPAELVGLFASIGIKKGQPFQPDERMQEILTDAAVANATARALSYRPRKKGVYFCPDRQWYTSFSGGSYEFMDQGERVLDNRTMFHYMATGITPAMVAPQVGSGSIYAFAAHDAGGNYLRWRQDLHSVASCSHSVTHHCQAGQQVAIGRGLDGSLSLTCHPGQAILCPAANPLVPQRPLNQSSLPPHATPAQARAPASPLGPLPFHGSDPPQMTILPIPLRYPSSNNRSLP